MVRAVSSEQGPAVEPKEELLPTGSDGNPVVITLLGGSGSHERGLCGALRLAADSARTTGRVSTRQPRGGRKQSRQRTSHGSCSTGGGTGYGLAMMRSRTAAANRIPSSNIKLPAKPTTLDLKKYHAARPAMGIIRLGLIFSHCPHRRQENGLP